MSTLAGLRAVYAGQYQIDPESVQKVRLVGPHFPPDDGPKPNLPHGEPSKAIPAIKLSVNPNKPILLPDVATLSRSDAESVRGQIAALSSWPELASRNVLGTHGTSQTNSLDTYIGWLNQAMGVDRTA